MLASHLVEVNELTPAQLCHYIQQKHYLPIKNALTSLAESAEQLVNTEVDPEKLTLAAMLFVRLKEETEQLIRNDTLILFPLIQKQADGKADSVPNMPMKMIQEKNKKILAILERLRQIANNYLLKPEWNSETRIFFEELFTIDQMIAQAIYLKENVLLPRLSKLKY